MTTQMTEDGLRSTDPAGRLVYLGGLAAVFVLGLGAPLLGLLVAVVLSRTVFSHRDGDANRLLQMGLLTTAGWVVLGLVLWLM